MIAGNAANTDDNSVSKGNICHRCWTSTSEGNFIGGAPCSGSDTVGIPQDTKCKMIRQTVIFPGYGHVSRFLFAAALPCRQKG